MGNWRSPYVRGRQDAQAGRPKTPPADLRSGSARAEWFAGYEAVKGRPAPRTASQVYADIERKREQDE